MTTTVDVDQLATAIAAKLNVPPLTERLWTIDEIAEYLRVKPRQVQDRYAPLPGFPRAIRLPTTDGHRSHPRWRAIEVMEWAFQHQEKARKSV